MLNREQKTQAVAALSEQFGKAKAAYLVDFKGLNVEEVTTLRKNLSSVEAEMKVVRNTLAKIAIKDHPGIETALDEHFVGTNAVVFSYGEPSASAKALSDFSKEAEELQIKSGVMDGVALTEAKIKVLANLPSKDELRAQLLGTFAAPMSKFVRTLNEVPSGFVRILAAKKDS